GNRARSLHRGGGRSARRRRRLRRAFVLEVTAGVCMRVDSGHVAVRFSNRAHGDLNADVVAPALVDERWRGIAQRPVEWLDRGHGTDVVVVEAPGAGTGRTG